MILPPTQAGGDRRASRARVRARVPGLPHGPPRGHAPLTETGAFAATEDHVYRSDQIVEDGNRMTCGGVRLRPVEPDDLPRLYEMQLDLESNRLAVTIPRTREAFDAHWVKALADPASTTRAVRMDEVLVGSISCFPADGQDHVGYWIDRAYRGMGIASRALELFLREVTKRPLVATAATSNGASLRVLRKSGFAIEQVRLSPATERYPECEEAVLVLR